MAANDECAAAADNDYLLGQLTAQLVHGQLQLIALRASNSTSLESSSRVAAAVAAHFHSAPCDVFPLIMQC
jgi:hypothetical protein